MDDDPVAMAAESTSGGTSVMRTSVSSFGGVVTTAEGDAIMKEIGKREVMIRNRQEIITNPRDLILL